MEQEQLDSKGHTWKCSLKGTPCQPAGSSASFRRLSRSLQSTQVGSVVTELQKVLTDTRCTAYNVPCELSQLQLPARSLANQVLGVHTLVLRKATNFGASLASRILASRILNISCGDDLSTGEPYPQFACDMQDVLQVCLCMLLSCVLPCEQRRSDSITELRQVALRRCWHVNHPRQPALSSFKQRRKGADKHGCKV